MFERLVKSVKRCLRKVIGQSKLSHDELLTILAEVEMALNSRPISAEDLEEPLTPSHLIIGWRIMSRDTPRQNADKLPQVNTDHLTRRAQHLSATIDHFWQAKMEEGVLSWAQRDAYLLQKGISCP